MASFPEMVAKTVEEFGFRIGISIGAQVVVFVVCLAVAKGCLPKTKDPVGLADTLYSIPFFTFLAFCAMAGTLTLYHDPDSRWQGVNHWSELYLVLYVSRSLVHIFMQPFEQISRQLLIMMTLHHIFSMAAYVIGLGCGRCHFWGCLDGCCELTTIFLNNLYLLNDVEIDGRRLKEFFPRWVVAANGIILWLGFIAFRLALFPTWLYMFYKDMEEAPSKSSAVITDLERYLYPAVNLVLMLLSIAWFVPLTRGMVKSVKAVGKVEAKAAKQN